MHPSLRAAVIAAASLALFVPTQVASADDVRGPADRAQMLAKSGHGAAVVKALGDRLPAAAATNRMSAGRLQALLERDPSAWVGPDGQLFYVEEAEALTGDVVAGTVAGAPTAAYPESQTFALHSLPGSTRTIFLDFDGATVADTWWNRYKGMPEQFYTGFTLDAYPGSFTSAEKAYIQQVWRIVAEKFAPFDVDVTTQDPGPAAYNRSGLLDKTYGDHVVITDNTTALNKACGGGCSGIALLGTFDNSSDSNGYLEPAWVFSSKTSKSPILTAHTVAHEVGHTFGLNHDGDDGHAYYTGHANWFPLMGSSARAVGQWSKGEYAGANNHEDDLAVIATRGAPLRLDDHSDVLSNASSLPTGSVADGVVGSRADRDVFAVDHDCTTKLTAKVIGVGAGASLDLSVTVLGADGAVVGSANPASGQDTSTWPYVPTGMDATVSVLAANAMYYVRVDGVGKGDPATNGYSDYASLGTYRLGISACDGTMPAMNLPTTTGGTTTTVKRAPSAPQIGRAKAGKRGGKVTAKARWAAPATTGGATIIGYRVKALRLDRSGRVVKVVGSRMISATSRAKAMRLAKGRYTFKVIAYNRVGRSPVSAPSRVVRAR